jgi:hypothetical protein
MQHSTVELLAGTSDGISALSRQGLGWFGWNMQGGLHNAMPKAKYFSQTN